MLVLSLYVVPLPLGHEGAEATSSVARMAVLFNEGSAILPLAVAMEDLTVGVSLLLAVELAVEVLCVGFSVTDLDVASCVALFDTDSLLSGQTTSGSQAFFEQHPLKPVD